MQLGDEGMDARRADGATCALFRMIAARWSGAQVAIYAVVGSRMRLRAATGGYVRPAEDRRPTAWRTVDPRLALLLERRVGVRVDAEVVGLGARFCALHPLCGPSGAPIGFLVVCDERRRRLAGGPAAALADGARIAAALLPAERARPQPDGAPPPPTSALRMIDAARAAGADPSALLLVSLDSFRTEDGPRREGATEALRAVVATRLQDCLEPGDRIGRLGGDRFVIVAARGDGGVAALAARLLAAAERPLLLGGRSVMVRARVGVVADLAQTISARALLRQAEAALRRADDETGDRQASGAQGRGAPPGSGGRLERELAEGAARGQMRLVYQGYVDLATGAVSGVEALLRWRHPSRGELAPAAFIPLAEATGLILPLGAWALRTALAAAARWPARLGLSVNVSALQFHQPGFVGEVDAALRDSGVAPERLELEITETVLMRDNREIMARLDTLVDRGVRIALDDFGTGYSALAYLGRLPHHRIKLDRAFVRDLGNPATLDLVEAILALARKSGVSVTAEGVERADQLRLVRTLGFSHAQGFFTGPPVDDPVTLLAEALPAE